MGGGELLWRYLEYLLLKLYTVHLLVLQFLGEPKQYTRHFQTREIEVIGKVLQEEELQPTADISAAEVLAKS